VISTGFGSPLVGRTSELDAFADALHAMTDGHGRIVAISGEPGVGKTRLMAELADKAQRRNVRVMWSQMIEDPAAPPYFHWRLALRSCLNSDVSRKLLAEMPSVATDLAYILPEMQESGQRHQADNLSDSGAARFQLYDSTTRYLLALSKDSPLLILLDNLQLADDSSLGLLRYFCQYLADQRVLVVVAYRDAKFESYDRLQPTISALSRSNIFSKLAMRGLSRPEVAELLRRFLDSSPPTMVLDAVFTQSGGNPLFVTEVAGILARSGRQILHSEQAMRFEVPDSLRQVIATRLHALSSQTYEVLRVAAIAGQEFDLPMLAHLAESGHSEVSRALEAAEVAGVIASSGPERYQFHHVLFRELLYAEHNTVSRVMLHRRAGEHIEQRYFANLQPYLAQLAHHYFEAAQTGREDKAIHYCRLAAKSAMAGRAYSEASTLLERALQAERLLGSGSNETRFELLRELGQAQYRSGYLNASSMTLMRAAVLAHRKRWWSQLAEALFLFQHVCQQSGLRHIASISLHEQVLANLPDSSVALRARVLASLARAHRSNGNPASAIRAFRKSIALARELDNLQVLLACLNKGAWTVGRQPSGVREGLDVALESLELARNLGSTDKELDSLADVVFQLCDLGEIAKAERSLGELKSLAVKERQVHFLILTAGFETALAILRGQWDSAIHLARMALQNQALTGVLGLEGRYAFQMFTIFAAQGGLEALADLAVRFIAGSEESRMWLPGQILLHCELGQETKAREALERLGDVRALPRDDLYPIALVYLADSCARLGDSLRCAQLTDLLMPYRGLNVSLPGTLMLGAASGYLAMLANVTHRDKLSRTLFEEAIEMNSDMQAMPALARVLVEYAGCLRGSGSAEDQLRAGELLNYASDIADRLTLRPLIGRIEELRQTPGIGRLTHREVQILELVAAGNSNLKIADALHVSHSTVATHVRNIFRKIGASNRTEAAEKARRSGLIQTA